MDETHVFEIPELLESIFLHLKWEDITQCILVCRFWRELIESSRSVAMLTILELNERYLAAARTAQCLADIADWRRGCCMCLHSKLQMCCARPMPWVRCARAGPVCRASDDTLVFCDAANYLFDEVKARYSAATYDTDRKISLALLGSKAWHSMTKFLSPSVINCVSLLSSWNFQAVLSNSVLLRGETNTWIPIPIPRKNDDTDYPILAIESDIWDFVSFELNEEAGRLELRVFTEQQSFPRLIFANEKIIERMHTLFDLRSWASCLNWTWFFVAGGSVLSAMSAAVDTDAQSDIDVFCHGLRFGEWREHLIEFFYKLLYNGCEIVDAPATLYSLKFLLLGSVVELKVRCQREITLQFVWGGEFQTRDSVLNHFDFSASQVALVRRKVARKTHFFIEATPAFVNWTKSGFAVNYQLSPRDYQSARIERMLKYITKKRVTLWRIPKGCNADMLLAKLQQYADDRKLTDEERALLNSKNETDCMISEYKPDYNQANKDEYNVCARFLEAIRRCYKS